MIRPLRGSPLRALVLAAGCVAVAALCLAAQAGPGALRIYYIDTEGGQSTLVIAPSGESLLVDTGNAGDRDLGRIVDTLQAAGVKAIDHLWTTHYHGDHVGALLALADRFPVGRFYDHGAPHPNDRIVSAQFLAEYEKLASGRRTIVTPGDTVTIGSVEITAVAAANRFISSNLPGGGGRNEACETATRKDESGYRDPDNGESAGFVLTYGRFRTIDLGDLTWNGELELVCPTNRIGQVDLYLTSHHGLAQSGSPQLVQALRPRVVVMNNGTRKGGAPDAFAVLQQTAGIEDLWQLHWSYNAGLENTPARFIANVDDAAHSPAYLIEVAARPDGTFTVTNTRNGFSKTYPAQP
ncbi:MAG: ComEC/Rec2 family competence protein [Vicinamibacterales bacterium]